MSKHFYLTRQEHFSASHRLYVDSLTKSENDTLFGKCVRVHGHNYVFEVTLTGKTDPKTGMIINLHDFKLILKDQIVDRFDHYHLNDLAEFSDISTTVENVAMVIWQLLKKTPIASLLYEVKIIETPRNIAIYRED